MHQSKPSLTFLLPCLNEEKTIVECISICQQSLKDLNMDGGCLVSDNGSSDDSISLATKAGAHVINVPVQGYGAALAAGINNAQTTYIVMGDSDLSYDFSYKSIKPYIDALNAGADLVTGNRFVGGIEDGAMPWSHRYVGTPTMTRMVNIMFGTRIGDINCGLRAFRRDKITQLNLKSTGMEFASEMIIKAQLARLLIDEVPTMLRKDKRDRSPHLRTIQDGLRHVWLWCKVWITDKIDK